MRINFQGPDELKKTEKKPEIFTLNIYLKNTRKKMLPVINNIYIFVPVLNYWRKK